MVDEMRRSISPFRAGEHGDEQGAVGEERGGNKSMDLGAVSG